MADDLPVLSNLVPAGGTDARLLEVNNLRNTLEQNFHSYEEVAALPAQDRDDLFKLLWSAQTGDVSGLDAIYQLIYDEVPVPCEEFILGRRFLNLRGLINKEKLDIICAFDEPHVRKMWIAGGSGGGKSFLVSLAMARMVYMLMCLRRPDLFYMLGPGSKIAVVNLSISKEQAREVIFSEFIARVSLSPWFAGRYTAWTAKAAFPKRVYAFSGGSSAISFYGYHTAFGSLDEASFLVDRQDRSIAEELVEALVKSLTTRFPRAYKLLVISTLRSNEDFLYNQIERVKDDGVRVL